MYQIATNSGKSFVQCIAKTVANKTRSASFREMQVDDRNHSVSLLDPELQKEPN